MKDIDLIIKELVGMAALSDGILNLNEFAEMYDLDNLSLEEYDTLIRRIEEKNIIVKTDVLTETTDDSQLFLPHSYNNKPLSKEDEINLFKQYQNGNKEVRDIIFIANIGLVVSIAKNYLFIGVSADDLIQEGNIGLLQAIELFDLQKDVRFSTFATWHIRKSITDSINKDSRTIRIPTNIINAISIIKKKRYQLTGTLGTEPTISQIAQALDHRFSEEQIEVYLSFNQELTQLDQIIGDNEDTSYLDVTPDDESVTPSEYVTNILESERFEKALATLTISEQQVIIYRYGLFDEVPHTLEQIAARFNVSKQAISTKEQRAIMKLRRLLTID